jgi:hypothetical protein
MKVLITKDNNPALRADISFQIFLNSASLLIDSNDNCFHYAGARYLVKNWSAHPREWRERLVPQSDLGR